jgi:deoxyribose-phosphate aldolase
MDKDELIDKIAKVVASRLREQVQPAPEAQEGASGPHPAEGPRISAATMASFIDHTLLRPEARQQQFEQWCDEALQYRFKSVCVNSSWVPFVAKKLRGTGILTCSVIGFPLGGMDTRSKAFEARSALSGGADELDMVINIGALKSGNYKRVEEDIRAIKRACRSNTILKAIIETGLLTEEEKVLACEIAKKAGADFVKTCTGFLGGGATVADIELMRKVVGPKMGVKASGGIRTFGQAAALIRAGADRLGCGSGIAVISRATAGDDY